MDAIRRLRGRSMGIRGMGRIGEIGRIRSWPIWTLPRWLRAFICLVVLANAVFLAVAASRVSIHAHDLVLFAALIVCSTATVELTRRVGENTGFVKDVHAIWELPVAMLLPNFSLIAIMIRDAVMKSARRNCNLM